MMDPFWEAPLCETGVIVALSGSRTGACSRSSSFPSSSNAITVSGSGVGSKFGVARTSKAGEEDVSISTSRTGAVDPGSRAVRGEGLRSGTGLGEDSLDWEEFELRGSETVTSCLGSDLVGDE